MVASDDAHAYGTGGLGSSTRLVAGGGTALNDSIAIYIQGWFEPSFDHPFLNLSTVTVPESVKPIPKRWIEDVEVQIDEGFGAEDGDILGDGMAVANWNGADMLKKSLQRLDLSEDQVAHPNVSRMNKADLAQEKRRVKQELKRYDAEFRKQFHRVPWHAEKEPMRPLYVYYRRLKTMITQAEGRLGRRGSNGGSDDEGGAKNRPSVQSLPTIPDVDDAPRDRHGKLRRASTVEDEIANLEARVESLQREKNEVRSKLQAFQETFVKENNRKIRFHKDILPIEKDYRMYKNLKEEIMKTEAQLRDAKGTLDGP